MTSIMFLLGVPLLAMFDWSDEDAETSAPSLWTDDEPVDHEEAS